MKDIIIPGKTIQRELWTLASCFIIANLINLYAILTYNTNFSELLTMIGYVTVTTLVLYGTWSFLRFVFVLIKKGVTLFFKLKNR